VLKRVAICLALNMSEILEALKAFEEGQHEYSHYAVAALYQAIYSGPSGTRPPRMLSLGGRLRGVVAYERLDHIGLRFCLIGIW